MLTKMHGFLCIEVKNRNKMTKKKKIAVIAIIAAVLLVGYLAAAMIVPRIMLHNLIKETLADVGEGAEYFTDYSAALQGETVTADNGHIAVEIPAECEKQENLLETALFYKENNQHMVIIMEADDFGDEMNLLDPEKFDKSDYKVEIGLKDLTKGFEGFGNGLPDSAYGTYKCAYMLDEEDYNPLSLKNQVAYSAIGVLKTVLPQFGEIYVYENGGICGFVQVNERQNSEEQSKYTAYLEIYTKDNLNKVTTVIVDVDNLEEAYAIMNSARPAV